ncbi:fas-binding factor 1 twitchy [Calliopsis andreniformis]|uniref:fas-binding factor 1 twitchy n=1 Tax=Calliopsis andreniformis TaxID=337506 RepID=UPI003FCC7A69
MRIKRNVEIVKCCCLFNMAISNTNYEEITQALEDLDSLDMELFSDSFKKSKSSTNIFKDSNAFDGDVKKRVIFKDSAEDTSLTDLLFNEDTSSKEKKSLFTNSSKTSLMEDLFKTKTPSATSIKSNNELESRFNFEQRDVNQLFSQKPSGPLASKSNSNLLQNELSKDKDVQRQKNVSRNEEDILTSLIDKADTTDDKPRRLSLRESLFENKPRSIITMDSGKQKNNINMESEDFLSSLQKPKAQSIDQSAKLPMREPRRGRRNTKIINDPLGLLSSDLLSDQNLELVTNENMLSKNSNIQNSKSEENLPEWLSNKENVEDKKMKEVKEEETSKDKSSNKVERISTEEVKSSTGSKVAGEINSEALQVPEHLSLLLGTQFNQQAAIMTMQQQEHELRTAAVLSQQNEQLSKVSNSQHSLLQDQEKQFNALLKLQLEKQVLLEKQIKLQQERINQYIQTLMAQPVSVSSITSVYTSCKSDENEKGTNSFTEKEEMENTIKILQAEKFKLENTLSTINERHESEVTLQTEFYERQISFLKEAMIKLEERANQEVELLEADYTTKFEKLKNEKAQMENTYKEEIHDLKTEHAQRIKELNELHAQNIKLLEKEYSNIVESISRTKQVEDQLLETVTSRKADIDDILQKASFIIETIKEKEEVVELKSNEITQLQENYFKVHEEDIQAQKLELKNQNRTLEEHRNKFMETSEKFDVRFTQLLTELQKQNAQNNQMQEVFEKKTAQLLRERELFEEKVKWERDYLQTLKESWLQEQKRQLKLLAEEREAVTAEKAQLEVLNRLKLNSDDITKVELETAIKTAQEATTCANREKLRWQAKINELDLQKQILQDKENLLILRAKELENLTQSALIKKEEGIKALKDAKHLENQHKEKLGLLQTQFKALIAREKKVVNEQYNITKGRTISLMCETEKPERDINIPHNFHSQTLPFSIMHSSSQTTSELMNIIDPNLIMLKLNLDN